MGDRVRVAMCCSVCGSRNYQADRKYSARTSLSETNSQADDKTLRLEMKKHCPKCNKHTLHKESK